MEQWKLSHPSLQHSRATGAFGKKGRAGADALRHLHCHSSLWEQHLGLDSPPLLLGAMDVVGVVGAATDVQLCTASRHKRKWKISAL